MEDWQQRVVDEQSELAERRKKLSKYTSTDEFMNLEGIDQDLLEAQWYAMNTYSRILEARIGRFQE